MPPVRGVVLRRGARRGDGERDAAAPTHLPAGVPSSTGRALPAGSRRFERVPRNPHHFASPRHGFRASSLHRTRIGWAQTATTRAEGRGRMGMRVTHQGSRRSGHGRQRAARRTGGAGSESLPSRSTYRHTRFGEGSACSPNPGLPIDLYAYWQTSMPTCRPFCLLSI